jgi:hypothetical protein
MRTAAPSPARRATIRRPRKPEPPKTVTRPIDMRSMPADRGCEAITVGAGAGEGDEPGDRPGIPAPSVPVGLATARHPCCALQPLRAPTTQTPFPPVSSSKESRPRFLLTSFPVTPFPLRCIASLIIDVFPQMCRTLPRNQTISIKLFTELCYLLYIAPYIIGNIPRH